MKIACLFVTISLSLSVSAVATFQKYNVENIRREPDMMGSPKVAAAAANNGAAAGKNGDPQSSLALDPKVLATGFKNNGQNVTEPGQVASLTSSNNFINFCLTTKLPITNGQQITTGSCNPAPMGAIPSKDNMPSAKFISPKNGDTVDANTAFNISMNVANFATGAFVNAASNYYSAPQQLNKQGQIIGHSHVVVEAISSLVQTTPTDPKTFAFFKGLNAAAVDGVMTAEVTAGLPAGSYRLSSINSAANHQPVLVPVAQRGALDDTVYFNVKAGAGAGAAAGAAAAGTGAAGTGAAGTGAAGTGASSTGAAGTGASSTGAAGADASTPATSAPATATGKSNKLQALKGNQGKRFQGSLGL